MDVEVIMSVCQKAITLTDWGSEQCYISHVWKGLYIQIPITNQHNEAYKAVRVKIIFLLNYCQYCLHVVFFGQSSTGVHRGLLSHLKTSETQKVEERKAAEGYEVRGLTLYQYPHSHLTDQTLCNSTIALWLWRETAVNCPFRAPERWADVVRYKQQLNPCINKIPPSPRAHCG